MKHGDRIKKKILDAGVSLWPDVTPSTVARAAELKSHAAVLYHFASDDLKDAVAEHAVKTGNSRVIVMLTASGHKAVKNLSKQELAKHFKAI